MNDIIERAAKAIYYGTAGEGDDRKGAYEADTGSHELCRDMARAVFMAIRVPSAAMMAAGEDCLADKFKPDYAREAAKITFTAMIDAALREDKP